MDGGVRLYNVDNRLYKIYSKYKLNTFRAFKASRGDADLFYSLKVCICIKNLRSPDDALIAQNILNL
jgi:hypothetical protein